MKTSDKGKSLDRIEARLTPQEWAIREAVALRKHPTIWDYFDSLVESPGKDSIDEAIEALERQTEERYAGNRHAYSSARIELYKQLWTDFFTLIRLLQLVNRTIYETVEKVELRAALLQSTLLLYAHRDDVDQVEFCSMLEKLSRSMAGVLAQIYAHQDAVKIIQDRGFDGHLILARDVEAGLEVTIKTVRDGVVLFNQCAMARTKQHKRDREKPLIDVDAIKNKCNAYASALATAWIKQARYGALIRAASSEESRRYAREYYMGTSGKTKNRNGDKNGNEESRNLLSGID